MFVLRGWSRVFRNRGTVHRENMCTDLMRRLLGSQKVQNRAFGVLGSLVGVRGPVSVLPCFGSVVLLGKMGSLDLHLNGPDAFLEKQEKMIGPSI